MHTFHIENLRHIQRIFEEKTGVAPSRRKAGRPLRTAALITAALAACLGLSAFGIRLFSALDGDELSFDAAYRGGGIVSIAVENRSGRTLRFQEQLKLLRWSTGEEIPPSGEVAFSGTRFAPHSGGIMTVDLSGAYDLAALEEPIGDWYYFILTNNNFGFGQDWMCSVAFSEPARPEETKPAIPADAAPDETALYGIPAALRPYFADPAPLEVMERGAINAAYMEQARELLAGFGGTVVPSVSPFDGDARNANPLLLLREPEDGAIFDETFTDGPQRILAGQQYHSLDWNFKMLATEGESALILSAMLPQSGYGGGLRGMPLYYFFAYEKAAVSDGSCAFLYGRTLSFSELERYRVWEDDAYAVYEVHELIYSDLRAHVRQWLAYNPDVRFDDGVWTRIQNIRDYYDGNMEFYYG